MATEARTPEELETLFEDAFLIRDREAVTRLFEVRGILVAGSGTHPARGSEEIGDFATGLWRRDFSYLADPKRVVQAHDTALVLSSNAINVVRRNHDGAWRYAISILDVHEAKGSTDD